jgi:hypothetical protein
VNVETSLLDTSKRFASWEVIVNSIVKEIDLSKIRITTYYPVKDSAGKQLIKEVVSIDNNKTSIESRFGKNIKSELVKKSIIVESLITEEGTLKTILGEKSNTKYRYYVIISISLLFVFCICFICLKKLLS